MILFPTMSMQKLRTVLAIAVGLTSSSFVGGCTIIYNTDNLHGDAMAAPGDAPPDGPPADANLQPPTLTSVSPSSVTEGTGSATGARPALVVLTGTNLLNDATVTAAWMDAQGAGEVPTVVGHVSSTDNKHMAVELSVPVNTSLDVMADVRPLIITVANNGGSATQMITMNPLEQLTIDATTSVQDLATASGKTYSQITINGSPTAFGDAPLILHATGNIALNAELNVSASGQTAGPGGCNGGAAASDGNCVADGNGGKAGPNTTFVGTGSGGGGGGYATVGGAGGTSSAAGGAGGAQSGLATLVPLGMPQSGTDLPYSRAGGGGGGGSGTASAGGKGGGGGGTVALWTDGAITVTSGSGISADGGDGTTAGSTGGGGAGGGVLLHAGAGIMAPTSAWISAAGGNANPGTLTAQSGGTGSVGRIRVDTPTPVMSISTPAAVAGPAWAATVPVTSNGGGGKISLKLDGVSGSQHGISVDGVVGGSQPVVTIGTDGTVEVDVPTTLLVVGVHTICALYDNGDSNLQLGSIEDQSCIDIAYLP